MEILEENDILLEAQKLNSELGHHVKQCSFSTHLTGRFYQNNSLESHKAKAKRIIRMKAKKTELERSVELEEKKIQFLEEKRKEWEQRRQEKEETRRKMEKAALKIQKNARRYISIERVRQIRKDNDVMNHVARFIQSLFRGKRDRNYSIELKRKIIQHRKEELAAIRIQCSRRGIIARIALKVAKHEKKLREINAVTKVQALQRGKLGRKFHEEVLKSKSATIIQSRYRCIIARKRRRELLEKAKKKKAKRIPLHERRYSTYALDISKSNRNGSRRRSSDFSGTVGKLLLHERRTSLTGLELVQIHSTKKSKSVGHSDNSSFASSSAESESTRIQKYRQKVAQRAMKQKRNSQLSKSPKPQGVKNIKEELKKLEQKRKEIMRKTSSRTERNAAKDSKDHGNSNEAGKSEVENLDKNQKLSQVAALEMSNIDSEEILETALPSTAFEESSQDSNVILEKESLLDKASQDSKGILDENDFNICFEEDFDENEDDLG